MNKQSIYYISKTIGLGLFLFFTLNFSARAQSCDKILSDAEKAFEVGNLYSLADILLPCVKNGGYNRDERIRALRLLTISSLYIDEPESAEQYFLALLKEKPDYQPQQSDPQELHDLAQRYTTMPRVSFLPLQFGITYARPSIVNEYTIDSYTDAQTYEGRSGMMTGAGAEITIKPWLSAGTGVYYANYRFSYRNTILGYSQLNFTENRQVFSFPLYLRLIHPGLFKKLRPYVYAGASYDLMIGAEARGLVRRDITQQEVDVTGPDIDLDDQRSPTGLTAMIGTGVAMRAGTNFILVDIGYRKGFSNGLDSDGQFRNSTLVYRYGFTDNDHTLNSFTAMVRFLVPLYAPRMVKKRDEL
ncbi:hypothetical protein AB9P05_20715 [Roseivirga sp. BDSF3-8]|uniref:hypothetical protein n=1 Tax=Roseivirga sp. BDSF3-8 TaxID=3241598 RepID=UPI003531A8A6